MASATPVVATPNPGAREVLDGGRYGVLAPPARLGETLVAVLRDAACRQRLATAGLARVADFDWARVVPQYERLYLQTMARKQRSPQHARLAEVARGQGFGDD
jgi:glycosyltransferase involved in cell wall biosynthesis